jgi:hypothetical protein
MRVLEADDLRWVSGGYDSYNWDTSDLYGDFGDFDFSYDWSSNSTFGDFTGDFVLPNFDDWTWQTDEWSVTGEYDYNAQSWELDVNYSSGDWDFHFDYDSGGDATLSATIHF